MTRPSIQSAELLPDEIDPREFLRDVRLQELLLGMYPITVTDDDLEALTALREAALADGHSLGKVLNLASNGSQA